MSEAREALLTRTFVALTDSLVDDYDLIDLLQTLVDNAIELFDATAAGITLGPDAEHLDVVVSTSEESRLIELMQVRDEKGPCIEAFSTGDVVSVVDPAAMRRRWPAFAAEAASSGYLSVHAIPLRLRGRAIGSFNLFRDREGPLDTQDAVAAQALADVATISLLQERTLRDRDIVTEQLERALGTRVVIEQAKGVISNTHLLDMDEAYKLLRRHARSTHTPLASVATAVVGGDLKIPVDPPRG